MRMQICLRMCALAVLLALFSGCETHGVRSGSGGSSAGVESLSPAEGALFQQAVTNLEQGQAKVAEATLQDLVAQRPEVAEIWINLALSQYQQQKFQLAEKTVTDMLRSFPKTVQAHNLVGLLAVEAGKFQEAQQHYENALRIDPSYAHALYNMALLQDIYLQNISAAVDYYNRYLGQVKEDDATKAWVENLSQSLVQ